MKNSVAWITLVTVIAFGSSSQGAKKSIDQSSRNESTLIDRKIQSIAENASPALGSTKLESPSQIRELLLKQQLNEQLKSQMFGLSLE